MAPEHLFGPSCSRTDFIAIWRQPRCIFLTVISRDARVRRTTAQVAARGSAQRLY
jgi:hypothetical protein